MHCGRGASRDCKELSRIWCRVKTIVRVHIFAKEVFPNSPIRGDGIGYPIQVAFLKRSQNGVLGYPDIKFEFRNFHRKMNALIEPLI